MQETFCPECEYSVQVGVAPQEGQRVICPNCRTPLVVVGVSRAGVELETLAKQQKKRLNLTVGCPECEHPIRLSSSVREGQPLRCSSCQADLEVVSIEPLEVDLAMPVSFKRNRHKKGEGARKKRR